MANLCNSRNLTIKITLIFEKQRYVIFDKFILILLILECRGSYLASPSDGALGVTCIQVMGLGVLHVAK